MAFSVKIIGFPKIKGQDNFEIKPYWWNEYQLMNDKRFTESNFYPGYLDFDAALSIDEMRELHERYRDSGKKYYQSEFELLNTVLYEQSDQFSDFQITIKEWESGM